MVLEPLDSSLEWRFLWHDELLAIAKGVISGRWKQILCICCNNKNYLQCYYVQPIFFIAFVLFVFFLNIFLNIGTGNEIVFFMFKNSFMLYVICYY
jgi:hypothetical protein